MLLPCPRCTRHVRHDESSCPFCNTGVRLGFGAIGALVLVIAGSVGCRDRGEVWRADDAASKSPTNDDRKKMEDVQRLEQIDPTEQDAKRTQAAERTQKAVYGGPGAPRPKPSGSTSAMPCPPSGPLCPRP